MVQQVSDGDVVPWELGDMFFDAVVDVDQAFVVEDEGGGCGKGFAYAGQLEWRIGF